MIIDTVVYSFDPRNAPAARVDSGAILSFRTKDCFSDRIGSENQLINDLDLSLGMNPATGPVYVEGACPGDILRVDILDVVPAGRGVVCSIPGCGPLHDTAETRTRVLETENGFAEFNGVRFALDPMIGVIGCTPAEPIPTGWVGDHGGNLDCKLVKKGASLYCPVYVAGALFQLGDVHAVMGDCELCGTGLEIPAVVTVRLTLMKGRSIPYPVLETQEKWYTLAHAKTYDEAVTLTAGAMQQLLMQAYGWDATDAFLYLSLQGDVEICQACVPCSIDMILRCGVPKQPGRPLL
ncbi:MAG: acetamidase/formamidase family protein [Lachnospiraceae bacterium]|nr:acetamidase/formamidase family protein [Lachnospiraceae bacterium]